MILQSLVSYYHRASDQLAQPGWIRKAVDFAVVLDDSGHFVTVNDLRETQEGKLVGRSAYLPNIGKQAEKHTNSGKDANLLWDDAPFVLGMKTKGRMTMEAFCAKVEEYFPDSEADGDTGIMAIKTFCRDHLVLDSVREAIAAKLPQKNGGLMPVILAFRLDGDSDGYFISDRPAVKRRLARYFSDKGENGFCIVTGKRASISKKHTVLKKVTNGESSGVYLVSFNSPAFNSYNKKDGANSPVGEPAMFAYTTALNHLLRDGSNQRMQVGDASTVFWSGKPSRLEEIFSHLFSEPSKDDPERNTYAVRALLESVAKGSRAVDEMEDRFHVLGLSPNAARVSVRFWITGTIREMEHNIARHFEAIRIVHPPEERDELSLFRLMVQTAIQDKPENIPPNLANEVMRSILTGSPYPILVLGALVRRARAKPRAKHTIPYARAAFLKACINRSPLAEDQKEKELLVSLDLENMNIGYRLGRLFAALEKTQEDALPGINANIRNRFYGSASSTPAAVFPTVIRTSKHHLAKLDTKRIFREKLLREIMDGIADFPAVLGLSDQGRFAIGYYHQMQDFYTKKADKAEAEPVADRS